MARKISDGTSEGRNWRLSRRDPKIGEKTQDTPGRQSSHDYVVIDNRVRYWVAAHIR